MRIGIATAQIPFLRDDGQARAEELMQAVRRAGHEAEIVWIPFNGRPNHRLAEQMLACKLLDLEESMGTRIDRLVSLTFPAYLVPHSAKVIWLLQRCRAAYDLWDTPHASLQSAPNGHHLRRLIRNADASVISNEGNVFVPSQSAAKVLRAETGIVAHPLLAPIAHAELYGHAEESDFLLLPVPTGSPLRESLVLQALHHTRSPVRLRLLAGPGRVQENDATTVVDASIEERIIRGNAPGAERRALFANCLAVVSTSLGESNGLVALEAMLSEKAIIACEDAGGVADLVHSGQTGFLCPPDPQALAAIFDQLWEDRTLAKRVGRRARMQYDDLHLSWDTVLERLLS